MSWLAYVGVVGQQEGLDLLVESVEYMVRELGREDVQFVVVGGGPELAAIRELAERLKLSDYITFTGRVDDATLMSALSTADVCVNPDRPNAMNDTSTMNKIMEYMAVAKPSSVRPLQLSSRPLQISACPGLIAGLLSLQSPLLVEV